MSSRCRPRRRSGAAAILALVSTLAPASSKGPGDGHSRWTSAPLAFSRDSGFHSVYVQLQLEVRETAEWETRRNCLVRMFVVCRDSISPKCRVPISQAIRTVGGSSNDVMSCPSSKFKGFELKSSLERSQSARPCLKPRQLTFFFVSFFFSRRNPNPPMHDALQ